MLYARISRRTSVASDGRMAEHHGMNKNVLVAILLVVMVLTTVLAMINRPQRQAGGGAGQIQQNNDVKPVP